MKLKLIVAAALVLMGGAALAQTPTTFNSNKDITTTSGLLTTTNLPIFPNVYVGTNNPLPGAFTDRWNFTFPSTGALASSNTISLTLGDSVSITGLGLRLFSLTGSPASNGSLTGLTLGTLLGTGTSTSAGVTLNNVALTPGQRYAYVVSGTDTGAAGGFYSFTASASPVPEPETYALFLAGLAAVGFVARRRAPAMGMAPAAA